MFCFWLLHHISPPYKIIKAFTQKQQSPVEWDNYILIKKLLMSDHSELETGFIWWFLVFMNCIMTVFQKTSLLKKHNIYTFESVSCYSWWRCSVSLSASESRSVVQHGSLALKESHLQAFTVSFLQTLAGLLTVLHYTVMLKETGSEVFSYATAGAAIFLFILVIFGHSAELSSEEV